MGSWKSGPPRYLGGVVWYYLGIAGTAPGVEDGVVSPEEIGSQHHRLAIRAATRNC
jgi:hypothetical protein